VWCNVVHLQTINYRIKEEVEEGMSLNKWVDPKHHSNCKYKEKRGYVNWCRKKKCHVTDGWCEEWCEEND